MSRSLSLIYRRMLRDVLLTQGASKQVFGIEICLLKKIQRTFWFLGLIFSKAYLRKLPCLPLQEEKENEG